MTPTKGACPAKYKLIELGAEGKEGKVPAKKAQPGKEGKEGTFAGLTTAEKETLLAVLPYVKFVKEGVDKKPTIQFSGANVQVVSGAAKESRNQRAGQPHRRQRRRTGHADGIRQPRPGDVQAVVHELRRVPRGGTQHRERRRAPR